ncbi:putative transcription factor WD40-like family [Dioscorea sansibarensis]
MAARSLFHCAAPRAISHPLCGEKTVLIDAPTSHIPATEARESSRTDEPLSRNCMDSNTSIDDPKTDKVKSSIIAWLESFGVQDWISCIGGTTQDAMASHIIVASALAVWYPSIVKDELAKLVVNQLIKLVMSTHDQYSSTAAELLAEGMESTWKACIGPDITHLVEDIFFQIECLSSTPASGSVQNPTVAFNVREALVGILLPSLAMADVPGFLNVIEGQIWATSSDSPAHLVSLKTLIRIIRGSPKALLPYLDKAIKFVLQTMDPGNSVMRKTCLNSCMITLREVARVFPMVALNETSTRLAVGDAIADIHHACIKVYDVESVSQIKVLDASGPLGLPNLLGSSETKMTTAITALSFSPDGEGLVAFSENGLMIRWWSLGTAWWEKLSRNVVPVQCTKLIFVPPEGLSPNSSRSSIMASIAGHDERVSSQEKTRDMDDIERLKLLLHSLDLSYRLQWIDGRKAVLTRHGHQLGSFQL